MLVEKLAPEYTLEEAFGYCRNLATGHYENFTVVSCLTPAALRPFMHSLYAFCRYTDDLGDEAEGDRLKLLDDWENDLLTGYSGGSPVHPIMIALQDTVRNFDIPIDPFLRLIKANRMDQGNKRYLTYSDLLHYCDHSANPVGHMVLYLFGYRDEERQLLSDSVCTGLQLANFWQDVWRDWEMGRIYIPMEDMQQFDYSEDDLRDRRYNSNFKNLMEFQVERARQLFAEGRHLAGKVDGRLKLDIKLFNLGGIAVLNAIEDGDYNVLYKRPTISKTQKIFLALRGLIPGNVPVRGVS